MTENKSTAGMTHGDGESNLDKTNVAYDPVTFSVILNRFNSIAHEMTLTLEQTAWTSILAECRDYSCAIYDAVPRQVAMFDAIPVHTTSLHLVVREIAEAFRGQIHDGDIYACNCAYRNNTHIGDLVTASPVFVEGEHLFWSVTKGHQMDTGAFQASSVLGGAQNVWQEGLQIPPLKFADSGVMRKDVIELYLMNLRYRELSEGDLLAQLGSIEKGRQRLVELCEEYGPEVVTCYVDAIIDYSDRRMTDEIRAIPDGRYYGEGWVDSDGYGTLDIPIKCTVTVEDDHVTVDYTGSGPQAKGGLNGSWATANAAAAIPFMYYIDPDIPHNHGCIKHISVIAPEGTICNARYPASTSSATIVPSDMMQDAINKAMVTALPERVAAGTTRCANVPQMAGVDERNGEAWGVMLFNNTGGGGAAKGADGWPLIESQAAWGGLKTQPVEQIELSYPLRIERMEIEPESFGHGEHIGGPGTRVVVKPLHGEMEVITFGDGCDNPPHGVLGGTMAIGGGQYVENLDTGKRTYSSASGTLRVTGREVWVGVSTGGGGWGNPIERPAEQVLADVLDGLLSPETAREVYGVVLRGDAEELEIDAEATLARRDELRRHPRPDVTPTTPRAATWLGENMRPGDVYLQDPQ